MPVKVDELLEVTIESISYQGEGVAKFQGNTLFIPYGAPGDLVRIRVLSAKKSYARGLIEEILRPGQRIRAKCPWFEQCGGCNLQHLGYDLQLTAKTAGVRTTLKRIGGINPDIVGEALPTGPWHYRNKLQAQVGLEEDRLAVGLFAPGSHNLIPVEDCLIQRRSTNEYALIIADIARETGISPWDEKKQSGSLRQVIIRHSQATGETLAALVVSPLDFPNRAKFLDGLKKELPALNSLVLLENPHPAAAIPKNREEIVWGPGYITDKIGDLQFIVSARSFWQVNPEGTKVVYDKVKEFAQLTGKETVLDIYCGTGSIGLYLAARADRVIGIESNPWAVRDAQKNALLNKIEKAKFYKGKAEDLLPQMVRAGLKADVIVLDPPRKGCEAPLLEAVASVKPERIIYVSCNPATLARDLNILVEKGYPVREVQPVDMFPQTYHVEMCVLLCNG